MYFIATTWCEPVLEKATGFAMGFYL